MRADFVHSILGNPTMPRYHGSGEDDTTSEQLKAAGQIAAVLIAKGHEGSQAIGIGHTLASLDIPQLRSIQTVKGQKQYGLVIEACVKNGIEIDAAAKSKAAAKLQSFFRSKHKQQNQKINSVVNIRALRFIPRTFMIMNGQYVDPRDQWSAASRGLSIADVAEINEFAHQGKLLTGEANSVLTIDQPDCQDSVKTQQLVIPVEDQLSNRALVKLWMTHFGQKVIIKAPEQNASVQLETLHVLALHVYRDHAGEEYWHKLLAGPAKTLLQTIRDDSMSTTQVFSRRWTLDNRPCDPKTADAFSMLITVDESQISKWLSKCGLTHPAIFVQIKRNDEGSDMTKSYRVIWLGKQMTDAISQTSSLDNHDGVIFKPPNSFGARIHVDHYETGRKALKGADEPVPTLLNIKCKYTVANLPPNVKAKDLEIWAEQMKWKCRVLRRFANGSFLLGSADPIPSVHVSMNGHAILVSPFEDMKKPASNIIAGKLQSQPRENKQELDEDPWHGQTLGRTPRSQGNHQQAWAAYKPTTSRAEQSHANANSEKRIATMEQEMQTMKEQIANNHMENQRQVHQLDSKITNIQQSLNQSLRDALQEQSTNLISTFETLMKSNSSTPKGRERSRSGGKH
eukprot:Skav202573  [mRNA]  locus=scaffold104:62490:64364:- [translate_table: standard]